MAEASDSDFDYATNRRVCEDGKGSGGARPEVALADRAARTCGLSRLAYLFDEYHATNPLPAQAFYRTVQP